MSKGSPLKESGHDNYTPGTVQTAPLQDTEFPTHSRNAGDERSAAIVRESDTVGPFRGS